MNFSNLALECDAPRLSLFLSKTDPVSSYFSINLILFNAIDNLILVRRKIENKFKAI